MELFFVLASLLPNLDKDMTRFFFHFCLSVKVSKVDIITKQIFNNNNDKNIACEFYMGFFL